MDRSLDGRIGYADPAPFDLSHTGGTVSPPPARSGPQTHACSRETAVAFVIDAVESTGAATRNDFDIDRIVSTAHAMADDWDLNTLQPETFWRIASSCIRQ
ncbi:hypothetical protein IU433_01475 [Nocardia puris]|uniref:Uncharacterized protein n=1 Tax=Nocardia puris TaxID=208602 RepID=A0A366DUW4_9NOCA|nr:hypothetical protein [Nocardia puris]MBF6210456.1 hypothetical protein [Nocardia puris]MBF6367531.1 hypothetical protein [Nocardia puris]MBF6457716.1 hypothetical protein [Nocardia puris]RBO93882.1 hypothetical protein DFR74_102302 [Nocardia puris]